MSILRSVAVLAVCVVTQSLVGCVGKDVFAPPPAPTTKKYLLTSSDQSPVAGSSMTITAQLVDPSNNAPLSIAGRVVSWSDPGRAGSAGGLFSSPTSITDVGGKVTVAYSTSTKAGTSLRIVAREADGSAGVSELFVTVAGPPATYRMTVNAPVVLAGNTVAVSASLRDINDNQVFVSGRVVTWTSSGTGGSFSAATSSTDFNGRVYVNFRTSATGGVTHVVTGRDSSGFNGSTTATLTVAGAQGIVAQAVVVGSAHSCVLDSTGMPSCWGWNESGQLGNGFKIDFPAPVPVSGTLRFVSLAAGGSHTCGISNNGEASCWGKNSAGQLGNNLASAGLNAMPVAGGFSFVALTAGNAHTCGLVAGGSAYCWGDNGFGQLGNGNMTRSVAPLAVQGGLRFVSLSAGGDHTCGVIDSGRAYCWGDNQYGQLGTGLRINTLIPTVVDGGIVFSLLSSGGSHTCGAATDGAAYCWGKNQWGQLGDGSVIDRLTPTKIPGETFTSLSAGFAHTCGLSPSGVASCWGSNNSGELGSGNVSTSVTPVRVAGNLVFASIATGGGETGDYYYYGPTLNSHTCGVTLDRTAYCWGYDGFGELGGNSAYGNSPNNLSTFPVKVAGQR